MRREEKPALRCKLCHQGFHQPCLEKLVKLTDEGLMPEVPGKMLWLCAVCAPISEVMTTVYRGNAGTSAGKPSHTKKRRKAQESPEQQVEPPPPPAPPLPPPPAPPLLPPPPSDEPIATETQDQNRQGEVETRERDNLPDVPAEIVDCDLYKRGCRDVG